MNRWFGSILFTLVCGFCFSPRVALAQTLTAAELRELAAQKEVERQELENLERETAHAYQLHNGTFFRRVYSDDFIGTAGAGQSMGKNAYINAIEASQAQYVSLVVSDIRVRLYEHTAVVTAVWSWRRSDKSGPNSRQARVIHVYVNGPRGWQAVASQETVLPG